jgi:hypothetical protein
MFTQLSLTVVCLYILLQHEHSLYGDGLLSAHPLWNTSKFVEICREFEYSPPVAILLAFQDRGASKTNIRPAG